MDTFEVTEANNEDIVNDEQSTELDNENKVSPAELALQTPKKIALTQRIQSLITKLTTGKYTGGRDIKKNSWLSKVHQVISKYSKDPYNEDKSYQELNEEYLREEQH